MFCHLIRTYQVVPISLVPVDTRLLFHLILCLVLSTFDYGQIKIIHSITYACRIWDDYICVFNFHFVSKSHIDTYSHIPMMLKSILIFYLPCSCSCSVPGVHNIQYGTELPACLENSEQIAPHAYHHYITYDIVKRCF